MAWALQSSPFGTEQIQEIAYSNGLYVAIGLLGSLATSPDGETWTLRTSQFGTSAIQGVVYGNGVWVIAGFDSKIATSTDGISWTLHDTSVFGGAGFFTLGYGNGLFVVGGDVGVLGTSSDGVTWTSQISNFGSRAIFSAHYANGLWVIVGSSGYLATSSDAVTWTRSTSSFGTTQINDVHYGNGLWVASGASGKLATSTNGTSWTQRASQFGTSAIYDAVYADDTWRIVGASAKIAASSDAITWTIESNAMTTAILSICAGSALVAVGSSGQIQRYQLALSVQITPAQGTIHVIGLDWSRAYVDAAESLDINLVGYAPKTHLDTYKRAPIQAELDVIGFAPTLMLGVAMTPARLTIGVAGQLGVFVNRSLDLISPDWVRTRYRCVLTGGPDGLEDVELPIKSFQTRFTDNYIYFSAVLPGVDQFQDAIADRPNGRLVVWRIYDYLDGHDERFVLASVPFETLRVDSGGRSGLTGTLSGNEYNTSVTPQTIELFDPVYYAATDGANRRYRCRLDPRLRVGDTAVIGDDSLTVGTIIHIVDVKSTLMEIAEA